MESNKLPEEFVKRIKNDLGGEVEDYLASLDLPVNKGLRVNLIKSTVEEVKELLGRDFEPVKWCETGMYFNEEDGLGKSVYHEAGLYYIQEPSAMSVAQAAPIEQGDRILDLCASPGGKSSQLASRIKDEGLLVSNEIHPGRAKILSSNIERMGIKNVVVTNETPEGISAKFPEYFDCVVVDAPCSGEGMFRKEEEAIPNWSLDNVQMCAKRQRDILTEAVKCVAPGGFLVYSTCTFAPEEDEENVRWLTETFDDFKIYKEPHKFWPHKERGEGHFVAVFKKAGLKERLEVDDGFRYRSREKLLKDDKTRTRIYEAFVKDFLTKEAYDKYTSGRLQTLGDKLFLVPDRFGLTLDKLKTLRPGLHMGDFVKDRFEPSHSLAMALKCDEVRNVAEVDEETALKYLRGESIPVSSGKGWAIVTIKGHPLGLGKISGGILKNHYPKGLRRMQ